MLVLLPPSAGKTAPRRGAPVALERLSHPGLNPARARLLDALGPEVRSAAAAPAARVYTGVLFQRLRLHELPRPAWRRVLIASALWGVVAPADRIPAYTVDMGTKLPGIGALAAYWRPALATELPDRGLVVDLRSGAYVAAWRPRRATRLGVRGFTQAPDGSRRVISHMAKRVRGDVARALLLAGGSPRTPGDVLDIVRAAGMRAEIADDAFLDVIE